MKQLIFINENYKLNQIELEKFIKYLSLNDLLMEYLPLIEEKISINELLLLIDKRYISFLDDKIIYDNRFSKEKIEIEIVEGKIFLSNLESNSPFRYFLYKICNNYIIIDYWK